MLEQLVRATELNRSVNNRTVSSDISQLDMEAKQMGSEVKEDRTSYSWYCANSKLIRGLRFFGNHH